MKRFSKKYPEQQRILRIENYRGVHRLNRDGAEIARNFMFRRRIRKIYVTPEQQAALTAGDLGIAYLAGAYHVLAPDHLAAVRAISAEHIVEPVGGCQDEGPFPVPDDLQW